MPEVRFGIVVDDNGSPVVEQFNKTLQKLPPTTAQVNDEIKKLGFGVSETGAILNSLGREIGPRTADALRKMATEAASAQQPLKTLGTSTTELDSAFGALFKSGAQLALGFSTVQGGLAALKGVIGDAITTGAAYETALIDIRNTSGQSAAESAKLRETISAIDPILGNSADLAREYNEALRATGDGAKALEIVRQAAVLTNVAHTDLATAGKTLVEVMQTYNLTTAQTAHVTDVLFAAYSQGIGSFNGFKAGLATALPIAKELGASFEDVAATVATLSIALKSPEAAGQALQQTLQALTRRQADLAAEGINLREVMGEKGITGVLQALRTVVEGNDAELKQVVGSGRNWAGILDLLGPLAQKNADAHRALADATGKAAAAQDLVATSYESSAKRLSNAWSNFTSTIMPPVLQALALEFNLLSNNTAALDAESKARIAASDAARAEAAARAKTTEEAKAAEASLKAYREQVFAYLKVQEDVPPALDAERDAHAALTAAIDRDIGEQVAAIGEQVAAHEKARAATNAAVAAFEAGLKLLAGKTLVPQEQVERETQTLLTNLQKIKDGGQVSFGALQGFAEKALTVLEQRFGQLPATVVNQLVAMATGAQTNAEIATAAFTSFGAKTQQSLQTTAEIANSNFTKMRESGIFTADTLRAAFQKDIDDLNKGAFKELPKGFEANLDAMNQVEQQFGRTLTNVYEDAQGTLRTITDAQLGLSDQTRDFLQRTTQMAVDRNAELVKSGTLTLQEIQHNVHNIMQQINSQDLKLLPDGFQAQLNKSNEISRQMGGVIYKTIRDALGNVKIVVDEWATEVNRGINRGVEGIILFGNKWKEESGKFSQGIPNFEQTFAAISAAQQQFGRDFILHLTDTQKEAGIAYGILSKDAVEFASKTKDAFHEAAQSTNEYGNELVKLTDQTKLLMTAKIEPIIQNFAKDVPGLLKQIADAYQELNKLQQNQFTGALPGLREYQVAGENEKIRQLKANLAALGVDEFGRPLSPSQPAASAAASAQPGTAPGRSSATLVPAQGGAPDTQQGLERIAEQRFETARKQLDAKTIAFDRQTEQQLKALEAEKKAALTADTQTQHAIEAQFANARRDLDAKQAAASNEIERQKKALEDALKVAMTPVVTPDTEQKLTAQFEQSRQQLDAARVAAEHEAAVHKQELQAALREAQKPTATASDQQRIADEFEQRRRALDTQRVAADRATAQQQQELDAKRRDALKTNTAASLAEAKDYEAQIQALNVQALADKRAMNEALAALDQERKEHLTAVSGANADLVAELNQKLEALDVQSVAQQRAYTDKLAALKEDQKAQLLAASTVDPTAVKALQDQIDAFDAHTIEQKRGFADTLQALEQEKTDRLKAAGDAQVAAAQAVETRIQAIQAHALEQKRKFNDDLQTLEQQKADILAGKTPGAAGSGASGGTSAAALGNLSFIGGSGASLATGDTSRLVTGGTTRPVTPPPALTPTGPALVPTAGTGVTRTGAVVGGGGTTTIHMPVTVNIQGAKDRMTADSLARDLQPALQQLFNRGELRAPGRAA